MLSLCDDEDFSWRDEDFIKNSQQTYLHLFLCLKKQKVVVAELESKSHII